MSGSNPIGNTEVTAYTDEEVEALRAKYDRYLNEKPWQSVYDVIGRDDLPRLFATIDHWRRQVPTMDVLELLRYILEICNDPNLGSQEANDWHFALACTIPDMIYNTVPSVIEPKGPVDPDDDLPF
jgi:hypothetical protein